MGPRYLVCGEVSGWFTAGRFLGPLAIVVGLGLLLVEPVAGLAILAAGFLVTLVMEAAALIARRRRRWIEMHDDGFTVIDSHGERHIRDEQVHSLAYSAKDNYSNGEPSGWTRLCKLWVSGESQPIELNSTFKQGHGDPVDSLLVRLIDMLEEGFNGALDHGLALAGDGWRLTKNEFYFQRGSQEQAMRLDEISAVETREGKMCVWQKGIDEPVVRLPVDGRNVWLMRNLVLPRLKTDEAAESADPNSLGRILFQRRPGMGTVVGLAIAGFVVALVGIGLLLGSSEVGGMIFGGIMMVAGPCLGIGSYACAKSNFRCHERGVYQAGMFGEKRLMYTDVASFSYGATRHYHNGVYTGTALALNFDPLPGVEGGSISYTTTVKNDDDDLDELRDFVAGVIANRMRQQLAAGHPVPWTRNMIFRPDGIEYTPSGFFGRKQTSFIPSSQYGGWNMDQGVFYLFHQGTNGAVMSEQVSEPNFYPGFFLLLSLYHSETETAEETVAAEEVGGGVASTDQGVA
jgi:hypothetical protein